MEKRFKTFTIVPTQSIKKCCLKDIGSNMSIVPDAHFHCNTCDSFIKSVWFDFNTSYPKGISVFEKSPGKTDYVPLSAIVRKSYRDVISDMERKFSILLNSIAGGLDDTKVIDTEDGREYVFNDNVEIEEFKIFCLGKDVFVIVGKIDKTKHDGTTFKNLTFKAIDSSGLKTVITF